MASWSRRRRSIYALSLIAIVLAAIVVPAYFYFHKAPTCFDKLQNGTETGVDCGGGCARLCPTAFLPPSVSWVRYREVAPDIYNVAAYIVNPNPNVKASNVPYRMTLYGSGAVPIATTTGTVIVPLGRDTLAFQGSVRVPAGTVLVRAAFEFTSYPEWVSSSDLQTTLTVTDKRYSEDASGSTLFATIANSSERSTGSVTVYAILKDIDKNVIDFSKTVIDSIPAGRSEVAPFTWPKNHDGRAVFQDVLPVAE